MFETIREAGGVLFVIGMVGRGDDGAVVDGGMRPQALTALNRIEAALHTRGGTRADIVRLRFYLTDMRLWGEARAVIEDYFGGVIPPSTAVGVTQLVDPAMLIEIDAEASAR